MKMDTDYICSIMVENFKQQEEDNPEMNFKEYWKQELENSPESLDCFFERSWDLLSEDEQDNRIEKLKKTLGRTAIYYSVCLETALQAGQDYNRFWTRTEAEKFYKDFDRRCKSNTDEIRLDVAWDWDEFMQSLVHASEPIEEPEIKSENNGPGM